MKLQKQQVYLPVTEHDDNNFYVVTHNDIVKKTVRREDRFVFSEEELRELLSDSFNAGGAYCLGSHETFKQTHPNKAEYINNLLKQD